MRRTVSANQLLASCFVLWPLFWGLWVLLRLPVAILGMQVPSYVLLLLAVAALFTNRTIKTRKFFILWLLYCAVIVLFGFRRAVVKTMIYDVLCVAGGVLFCVAMPRNRLSYRPLLKLLINAGVFVSITVIADVLFGVFQGPLLGIYTTAAREAKLTLTYSGGIFPYSATPVCYLVSAFAAHIALYHVKGKKWRKRDWCVIVLLAVALILLQKRGVFVYAALALVALKLFRTDIKSWRRTVNLKRPFQIMLALLLLVVLGIISYRTIPFLTQSVDSLMARFTNQDATLSGRTLLYLLAYNQFLTSPLTGIGWGRYRALTEGIFSWRADMTYEVHNVYLQLLCETGILGTLFFLTAVLYTTVYSVRKLRKYLHADKKCAATVILSFGVFLQMYFLIYCCMGNPLYDYNFLITYFTGILFVITI